MVASNHAKQTRKPSFEEFKAKFSVAELKTLKHGDATLQAAYRLQYGPSALTMIRQGKWRKR
jgi:hypothetical protein